MAGKAPDALRTIGELALDVGLPLHTLRYWEKAIPQLRPLTRANGHRYYRPPDVALVRRIKELIYEQHLSTGDVRELLDAERSGSRRDLP